ncbi:MAG: hypothetical protein ACYC69_06550 [Thermodesulfovibrionales bacterium]
MNRYALCLFLAILFSWDAASSQDVPVASLNVGECRLTLEVNEKWHTMRLRAHHPDYKACTIDRGSMVSVLDLAFSRTVPVQSGDGYSSLSLGRLIDYPWMSHYLAAASSQDPGWDSKRGRPRGRDINKYVSQMLFQKELIAEMGAALEKGGYRIAGVTVEKVLVGDFRAIPFYQGKPLSGRVPYDAQVWLRLKKTSAVPLGAHSP